MTTRARPELPLIDEGTLTALVRTALETERAQMTAWHCREVHSGGPGSRIYKLRGDADVGGTARPWSLVLKCFDLEGSGIHAASVDPTAWDYWKRDWLASQASWLHTPHDHLVAPRCLGAVEQAGLRAWVALEDLSDHDARPWSLTHFRDVARSVGAFNGSYLTDRPIPAEPWLSHHWLRGWTELAAPMIGTLPATASDPVVRQMIPGPLVPELIRLWEARTTFFDALDTLPQTFCHQDIFPRNVFIRQTDHGAQSVAIDWAFAGQAAIGSELACLVGASLVFFEADPAHVGELEAACLAAYLEGLAGSSWQGDPNDVRFGYVVALALRFAVGMVAPIVRGAHDDRVRGSAEQVMGKPFADIMRGWGELMLFQQHRVAEAWQLLEARSV